MKNRIKRTDFTMKPAGYGHYLVTYESPATGRKWTAVITDMEKIDQVKNVETPTAAALERLKSAVKIKSLERKNYA